MNSRFLDYRQQVLDPVSKSFCAAKWLNATVWLDKGATTSCHHPPYHHVPLSQVLKDPSALHNTERKKEARRQMLSGERPKECDYCWKIEDAAPDAVSDRVFKSIIHAPGDLERISKPEAVENAVPRTLEISFGRSCQFACSYCNDSFSTSWSKDLRENGGYADLRSTGGKVYRRAGRVDHLTRDMNVLEKLRLWTRQSDGSNPYVEAFWKWWPELSRNLTELRVTGGEPLLSPDFWKLVERFQTERPNVRLAVNSNLGVKTESIDRLAQAARELPTLEVYTSCEAFGAAAEYIRDGMDYRQWRDNVFKLHRAGVRKIHVMMTINALCLFSLTDLFDDILSWRHELDPEIGSFTLNILRFPAFQNVLVLPEETRRERARHLTAWLDRQKSEPYLYDMEIAEIRRLVEYLEKVPRAHDREPARRVLWDDFQSFYRQYDIRRGKSLADAIPALSSVR